MDLLNLTATTAIANVALDEALLEEAEESRQPRETLRLWEPDAPLVVIGRSSQAEAEVQLDYCRAQKIPVLRRASGGAAIVTGPGCLMYALVLSLEQRPELRSLDEAHRYVLNTLASALQSEGFRVSRQGTSDLAITASESSNQPDAAPHVARKISGNSVRVKRRHLLYHGTLLYNFPLEEIGKCLAIAPRQPVYRAGRDHEAFVANLPLPVEHLRTSLAGVWQAHEPRTHWPQSRVHELVTGKYQSSEWTIPI